MSQLFKYLLVALICLALGALTGILLYNHLSPVSLLQKGLHTAEQAKNLAKGIPQAVQGGGDKKDTPSKEGDTPKKEEAAKDTSQDKKGGDDKKDTTKGDKKEGDSGKENDSTEYLRSLWPIKKRRPTEVSGEPQGKLYLEGTNPYGPPATYKEDLFSETKALTLPGDPPTTIPPPLRTLPPSPPLTSDEPALPPASFYQVEIGQFSSLEKAQEARDILRSKGEEVEVYYTGTITDPDWFYVRLSALFSKPQAYQKAQTIAILEKIVPAIVAATTDVKRIS